MCSLQEGAIFSVLNPPPKGQVWEHICLVESACAYHHSDVPGPCSPYSWCYTAQDSLDCWAAGLTPQAVEAFLH